MDDLVAFLRARIDEDEAVAREAIDAERPGTRWRWERANDDVPVDHPTWEDMPVSLRTVETFPTTSGVGDLPGFPINHVEVDDPYALPHIARHDPARVLREVEAKRALIGEVVGYEAEPRCQGHPGPWQPHGDYRDHGDNFCRDYTWDQTLRHLASVYDSHQDYREEWRP